MNINEETGNGTITLTYKNCREGWGHGEEELTNGTLAMHIASVNDKFTYKFEFKNFESKTFVNSVQTESSILSGYYEIVYNGSLIHDDIDGLSFSVNWNLVGKVDGERFEAKGNMTCKSGFDCSYSSDITVDGKTYLVKELTINDESGKTVVTGKVYHPDYGYYSFDAKIAWSCDFDEAAPFVGEITYKDNNGLTFNYSAQTCINEPTISFN